MIPKIRKVLLIPNELIIKSDTNDTINVNTHNNIIIILISSIIYDTYNTLIGPNDILNPNICKKTNKTIILDDKLNISNAIYDPIKLKTIIDCPISIKYLRPYLSKNNPLRYVIIT